MNITRLGHYFTPNSRQGEQLTGSCRAAMVTYVPSETKVHLAVWNQSGGEEIRTNVDVEAPGTGHDSFHLSQECPWVR